MKKSGWILLLVLICVAFLVSCGKKNTEETEKGELVRSEAVGDFPAAFVAALERNLPLFVNGEIHLKSLTEVNRIGII